MEELLGAGGQLHLNDNETKSKWNGLTSLAAVVMDSNSLSRVPSLKNMGNLTLLLLGTNKITMIAAGDFAGATRLVALSLGGNKIVSVAVEAFENLAAFRVTPEKFNPVNEDGRPFTTAVGIGMFHWMARFLPRGAFVQKGGRHVSLISPRVK